MAFQPTNPLFLFSPPVEDRVLLVLILTTGIFFILALFFALFTIILRISNIRQQKRWENLEKKWDEMILEVLDGDKEPEEMRQWVQKQERYYFIDFLVRYAQRLIGEERKIIADLADPFLPGIARRAHRGDIEQRARAVRTLSILNHRKYRPILVNALEDPSPLVSMIAAQSLLREKNEVPMIDAVLKNFYRYEHWSMGFLSSMLSNVGISATPSLRKVYMDCQQPNYVRAVMAEALRELNDFYSADLAVEILRGETDRDLLSSSLRLLAQVGQPRHLGVVRQLCDSADEVVRANALHALGSLGDRDDLSRFCAGLDDASPWVAQRAVLGLKQIGALHILQDLIAADHPRSDLAKQVLAGDL